MGLSDSPSPLKHTQQISLSGGKEDVLGGEEVKDTDESEKDGREEEDNNDEDDDEDDEDDEDEAEEEWRGDTLLCAVERLVVFSLCVLSC